MHNSMMAKNLHTGDEVAHNNHRLLTRIAEIDFSTREKKNRAVISRTTKPKILVADDEHINRMIARAMLEDLGYEVDLAKDGKEALAMYNTQYCAVILDLSMPEMEGYEVCEKIRAMETSGVRVPIIAATAFELCNVEARCIAAGMDQVTNKPISQAELKEVLDNWLQQTGEDF